MDSEFSVDSQFQPNIKYSGLGIASFVISILNGLGVLFCFGVPAIMHWTNQVITRGTSLFFGLVFFAVFLFSLVGIIISLISILQPRRKKLLPVIGLLLNIIISSILAILIVPELVNALS